MKAELEIPKNGKALEPAFPLVFDVPNPIDPRQVSRQVITGMTLRDYFASQAMNSFLTDFDEHDEYSFDSFARDCYRAADALLKARQL